ncbi:Tn3 family transposase [Streptosporangium sp. NBC_01756]|uniref:Tn3 family transposase n=1 Tax=Streptosporangium sp. NBC_01756 TaxID=2975950 RepID=UPI002DD9C043|nr:Tn3 family transposase [Streptosporangium sp. NBC_01756]WSC85710.1 transposase [Streptosporangium sp. NBC_01756]
MPSRHGECTVDWELIAQQYDQMVKYATALKLRTGEAEHVLRRFTRGGPKHPTYRAIEEVGRAAKSIFIADYVASEGLCREIHEGLQLAEYGQQRCDLRAADAADEGEEFVHLHRVAVGDRVPGDEAVACGLGQSRAAARGTAAPSDDPLERLTLPAFERLRFPLQVDTGETGEQALVGGADRVHADGRFKGVGRCVKEDVTLFGV